MRKTTPLLRKLRLRRRVAKIVEDLKSESDLRLQSEVFEALQAAAEAWSVRLFAPPITKFSAGVQVGERPPGVVRGVHVLEVAAKTAGDEDLENV